MRAPEGGLLLTAGILVLPFRRRRKRAGALLCALALVLTGLGCAFGYDGPSPNRTVPPQGPVQVTLVASATGAQSASTTLRLKLD